MTDYNDGKWHGWNGGECPVHSSSHVEWYGKQGNYAPSGGLSGYSGSCIAIDARWSGEEPLVAFRVIKAYREPREAWAVGKTLHDTEAEAQDFLDRLRSENPTQGFEGWRVIRMVEVME